MCGYAIVTAADAAAGRFTFSQLLVTTVDPSNWVLHLHLYSAATHSWSAPTPILRLVDGRCRFSRASQRSAVVHQGAAHWLWLCDDTDDGGSLYKLSVQLGAAAAGPICFAEAHTFKYGCSRPGIFLRFIGVTR